MQQWGCHGVASFSWSVPSHLFVRWLTVGRARSIVPSDRWCLVSSRSVVRFVRCRCAPWLCVRRRFVVGRSSSIHVAAAAHSTDARLFSGHSHTAGPAQSPRSHHWHAARLSLDLVVDSSTCSFAQPMQQWNCFITTCSIHELLDHCCSPVGSWFVHRFIRPLVRSSQLIAHHLVQRLSGWAVSVRRQACA